MKMPIHTSIASAIALIVSIISLCIAAYRTPELSFDYQGVLVGVLAALVTALVGWNIYTLIDIRKLRDDLTHTKISSAFNAEMNNGITFHALGDFYYYQLMKSDPLGVEYQFLHYRIGEIRHFAAAGQHEMCETVVSAVLSTVNKPEDIKILQSGKDRLLSTLYSVNTPENIPQFSRLVEVVARLGVEQST